MHFTAGFTGRIVIALALAVLLAPAPATQATESGDQRDSGISPARKINHDEDRSRRWSRRRTHFYGFQSIDGSGNNRRDPEIGAAGTALFRLAEPDYSDGMSSMAGSEREGARWVSNAVHAQDARNIPNRLGASDYLWQWGQFLDHDIDLTEGADPAEPINIAVPTGDPMFDPKSTGTAEVGFNRSIYVPGSGSAEDDPREQVNEITAWIDASNVYGSDLERAAELRTNDGTGRLKVSQGNLLPFNENGLPNAGGSSPELFLAGDVRANEQAALTAMHTLFVREHNRLARNIQRWNPWMRGELIYQLARKLVIAEMQVITYREFLPALLGPGALRRYRGYNPSIDASISNEFSTASYRFGHSALSPTLLRLDKNGKEIEQGHLPLRGAFFNPRRILDEGGIEPLLRGLAAQKCQAVDVFVVDDVRNFLFGPPGSGGFDLASLNIQRGRDHGIPGYNDMRETLGLGRVTSFEEISSDPEIQERLASIYEDVNAVDMWTGGLAEDPLPRSHVGELNQTVLVEQFEALRAGDRFWYERQFSRTTRRWLERTKLSDIIHRNTKIHRRELPRNVFQAHP